MELVSFLTKSILLQILFLLVSYSTYYFLLPSKLLLTAKSQNSFENIHSMVLFYLLSMKGM